MTKEQIFADFFIKSAHGDKSIMSAMLDTLLKGSDDQYCKQVIRDGYIMAIEI